MDIWQLALYGVASFLALQSLISLMTNHQQQYRQQLLVEVRAQEKIARKKAKKEAEKKAAREASNTEEVAA